MIISAAFQPIVNVIEKDVFSYEALLRGPNNEPAALIFSETRDQDLIKLDQQARKVSLDLAGKLQIQCHINLNFLPRSFVGKTHVAETIQLAEDNKISRDQIIIEITEAEAISDPKIFRDIMEQYRDQGMKIAIDDFGAGHAGLNMLADFIPDLIKLDIHLIRSIYNNGPRQAIVKALIQVCLDLGIDIIAEGVEKIEEYNWLFSQNIALFQGFLFAKPGFETLPEIFFPD